MQTCLSWVPMSTTTVDVLHSTYNATQAANFCRRKERKMFFKVCTFNIACWSVSFFSLLLLLFSLFASICIYVYFYACVTFLGACMSGSMLFAFWFCFFSGILLLGSLMNSLLTIGYVIFFYLPFGFFGDAQFEIKAYLLDKSCRKFFKTLVWKKDCIFSLNTEYKMKSRRDSAWFVIGLFCCWEILGKCKMCETYVLLLALIWTAKCWVNVSFISYKVEDVRF